MCHQTHLCSLLKHTPDCIVHPGYTALMVVFSFFLSVQDALILGRRWALRKGLSEIFSDSWQNQWLLACLRNSSSLHGKMAEVGPKSVLFVCLGNICRSPIAEAVFRKLVTDENVSANWRIDSGGYIYLWSGEPPWLSWAELHEKTWHPHESHCTADYKRKLCHIRLYTMYGWKQSERFE